MRIRSVSTLIPVAGLLLTFGGCGGIVAGPVSVVRPMSAPSMDVAMRAALSAASSTNWTPTTISAETGYILATREVVVIGADDRSYRLEVNLPPAGTGEIRVRVVPPAGTIGGGNANQMMADYMAAYEAALSQTPGAGVQRPTSLAPGSGQQDVSSSASYDAEAVPVSDWAAGLNVGSAGYSPALQFNMGDRVSFEGTIGLLDGATSLGGEAFYRFPLPAPSLTSPVAFEPIAGGGLHAIMVAVPFGYESVVAYSGTGGAFMHLVNYPHWRFKGALSLLQLNYEGVSANGFNTSLGAFYFF